MNCFNHPGVPAVGICKSCQKGLCMECAVDLGHGIACKNHREDVEMLITIQADSKRALQNTEVLIREITAFFVMIFLILLGHSMGTDGSFVMSVGVVGFCLLIIISPFTRMNKTRNK